MQTITKCMRRAQLAEAETLLASASNEGPDRPRFLALAATWGRLAAQPCTSPCGQESCQPGEATCN